MEFSYEEVLEAYTKLKTYIYYDATNLFMRKQLAIFETDLADSDDLITIGTEYHSFKKEYKVEFKDGDFDYHEEKLKVFTEALNNYDKHPEYFNRFLDRIRAQFLPKKFKNEQANSSIITNKRVYDEYKVERTSVFIDAPIEIHLISVLWILRAGVELDNTLFEKCLGNRLILNKEKGAVVQGSGLFKPYPKQYQKWRDDAVEVARENMNDNKDVLILNLDIKDFFYSVRLDPKKIKFPFKRKSDQPLSNLYLIFEHIHIIFSKKLSTHKIPYDFSKEIFDKDGQLTHYILPIGLLSSFILANDYLKDFDDRIIKHARPAYYGRYVDDILMVIANPVLPKHTNADSITELNFDFQQYKQWVNNGKPKHDRIGRILFGEDESIDANDFEKDLTDIEQFVLLNFHPIISLIDKPLILGGDQSSEKTQRVFKLNSYPRLYCQSDKTLLYYFDKDESSLVIDKLKRDLEEKSSEFRNYNDEEDLEDFEESAYHLLYDGTEGKIRTLKDYKEDKFGLSVYLSKRIFNSLRRADKISSEEADKIVKFFQGENALNLYTLWERVFVFLLVNRKPEAYVNFYINCCKAIDGITLQSKQAKISSVVYRESISEYLENANELALSLYPKFLSDIREVKKTYQFSFNTFKGKFDFFRTRYSPTDEESYFIRRYRQSNLLRHHYTAQPLLSYTKSELKDYQNFTELKIPF